MSNLIEQIIASFEFYAVRIPVELFTFVGAFIEEVIAPIPSPIVMTLAGSVAGAQDKVMIFLLWLALIGAVGKTLGACLLYFVADKAEDLILRKFGGFLGVSHKEIENIGRHFNGSKWDDIVLFVIRSLPVVPSAPISIVCGFIKLNFRTFIVWTFFGTIIRNLFFLYFGYLGISNFQHILKGFESIESFVEIGIAVIIFAFIAWIYLKRKKHADPIAWVRRKLGDK